MNRFDFARIILPFFVFLFCYAFIFTQPTLGIGCCPYSAEGGVGGVYGEYSYPGQYNGQYFGEYPGQYPGQYGGQYFGEYPGQYGGQYFGEYPGQYGGQYPGQYPGQYGGQYFGQYPGQYGGQYPGQYGGEYDGEYPGQYGGEYSSEVPLPVCGNSVCEAGETANSCPADCGYTLSGTVYVDNLGNSCASGNTGYAGSAGITIYNGAVSVGSATSDGSGVYSARDTQVPGNRTAVISNVADYTVKATRFQGGAWGTGNLSGFTYGPFNHSANQTLDWCISAIKPWYQVDTGDVRRVSIVNKVPAGKYFSSDPTFPGIVFSSAWTTDFGQGQASTKNWKIDDEYSYNKNSSNKNGTVAYSYYRNRAATTGQVITPIPGCENATGETTCGISGLASGIYEFDGGGTGTLNITSYAHTAGAHVVILINGNLVIKSNIVVPSGVSNLLIVAAKGNMTIDRSVGESSPSSAATNLDGIYSAEGKITLDGDTCPTGTPDKRLNIAGILIANAQKPFSTSGAGTLDNKRSLCPSSDGNYPVLLVKSRLDFLFQLSDFYKVPFGKFSQVQP